eukprot:XP_028343278.1 uncharacterized protein LOC112062998 [Physeter catodon]
MSEDNASYTRLLHSPAYQHSPRGDCVEGKRDRACTPAVVYVLLDGHSRSAGALPVRESVQNNLLAQYNSGAFQEYDTVCHNYGKSSNKDSTTKLVRSVMLAGFLNSHNSRLVRDPKTKRWDTKGNMSEGAIVVAAAKCGYGEAITGTSDGLPAAERKEGEETYERVKDLEVPFSSSRKMKMTVHKLPVTNFFGSICLREGATDAPPFTHCALLKGAPDRVLQHVKYALRERDGVAEVDWRQPLTEAERLTVANVNLHLSEQALRVLAFTMRPLTDADVQQLHKANGADERLRFVCSSRGATDGIGTEKPEEGKRDWVTNVDFWNPQTRKMEQVLGAVRGKHPDISVHTPGLDSYIRKAMEGGCPPEVDTAPNGFCMPKSTTTVTSSNDTPLGAAGKDYYDVSARGARMGRTCSFITAVWCEMLRAYTVRSWKWFFLVFNRNPWMHLACSISATLTSMLTVVPGIQDVFSTVALSWWMYLFAIGCGFLNLLLDELIPKPLYRYKMAKEKQRLQMLAPTKVHPA